MKKRVEGRLGERRGGVEAWGWGRCLDEEEVDVGLLRDKALVVLRVEELLEEQLRSLILHAERL